MNADHPESLSELSVGKKFKYVGDKHYQHKGEIVEILCPSGDGWDGRHIGIKFLSGENNETGWACLSELKKI